MAKKTAADTDPPASRNQGRDVNVQPAAGSTSGKLPFDCGAAISTETMERFVDGFAKSTRRWEVVVYPALFAFVVLAAYGFFLIFSLTEDLDRIAAGVDRMNDHIALMNSNVADMSGKLDTLAPMLARLDTMDQSMASMTQTIGSMDQTIKVMDHSVRGMATTTDQMRHHMGVLTHNVARPMSIMNSFMP